MKKVVFLIGGLNFGGMERVVFIAHELLKSIYDVSIVTLYKTNADYNLNFEVYDLNLPPNKGKFFKAINMLKRINAVKQMKKDLKPDIVISFGMYTNYLNVLTKESEKIIISIRSYDWLTKPFLTKKIDKWIIGKADSINSVSEIIALGAEKIWKIDKELNSVIYNPYNVQYIKELARQEVNQELFLKDYFTIVSAGRLADQKGYNHLIKAMSLVIKKYPKVQLIILGNGERRQDIEKLVDSLEISKNVSLIGGKKNPYKYMQKADLYVLSSLAEGFPNALVEAMCVNTPILATDCKSGPREILSLQDFTKVATDVEVCEYGILVPPVSGSKNYDKDHIEKCDELLAKGIIFMIENEKLRRDLAIKSDERVEKFSYDLFKNNMIKELNKFND